MLTGRPSVGFLGRSLYCRCNLQPSADAARSHPSINHLLTYTVNYANTDMPPILPILTILVHSEYKMPVGHSDALDIFSHSHTTLR